MGSIKNVITEVIEGHEDYHMMVSTGRACDQEETLRQGSKPFDYSILSR